MEQSLVLLLASELMMLKEKPFLARIVRAILFVSMVRVIFPNLHHIIQYKNDLLTAFTFSVDSTLLIVFIGASTPCCQGGGPQPVQDALCGYWFNTQGVGGADAAFHVPVCGGYYSTFCKYFHDIDFKIFGQC